MTASPDWRAPWDILARDVSPLPPDASLEARLAPLLANLARVTGTGYAALWLPARPEPGMGAVPRRGPGWALLLGCQASPGPVPPAGLRSAAAATIAALSDRPGVRALTAVPDGGNTAAVIMVGDPDAGPGATVPAELLDQTRDCVALLLREDRLTAALRGELARSDRLANQAARVEADLTRVREVERQRLAGWVLAGATRQLAEVTRHWLDLARVAREDPDHAPAALRGLRGALDELIAHIRTVVRAVHPSMLRGRGAAAALGELAGHLPGGVQVTGDLGRRVGWEVESGLYHAAAAALAALLDSGGAELSMRFTRAGGRLGVRVSDRSAGPLGEARALEEVRASLADDARRLRALGGGLSCHGSARGQRMIDLWLPERLSGLGAPAGGGTP